MEANNKKSSYKKIIVIFISTTSFVLLCLIGIMIFVLPTIKKDKAIEQADALVAMGKYEEGIIIYE